MVRQAKLGRTNRMKGICTEKKTIIIGAIAGIVSALCAATDEIDVARCETDAILSVPKSCTVVVSNATTVAGVAVIPGRYPVITGSAVVNDAGVTGSAAFADWTVELAGKWSGCTVRLEMSDTGLYIGVKKSELSIFVR